MATTTTKLLTVGDLSRDPRFEGYTRRQIEYALDTRRIDPVHRLGILRGYSEAQVPAILAALRTIGVGADRASCGKP